MEQTANVFPVPWAETLAKIKKAEEQDVLHDNEKPKVPRNKLIYLTFLVIHMLVEYPAFRIALAYKSVSMRDLTLDRIALIAFRVTMAIVLLPVFFASWIIVVLWILLYWTLTGILTYPFKVWKSVRTDTEKKLEEEHRKKFLEPSEKTEDQDADKDDNRKGQPPPAQAQEDKDSKKKQPKRKDLEEEFERSRSQARKEEEERLQGQVKLLINPAQMYDEKARTILTRRKKTEKQKADSSETSMAAPLLDNRDVNNEVSGPAVPPTARRRSIWSFFRHRNENPSQEKEAV